MRVHGLTCKQNCILQLISHGLNVGWITTELYKCLSFFIVLVWHRVIICGAGVCVFKFVVFIIILTYVILNLMFRFHDFRISHCEFFNFRIFHIWSWNVMMCDWFAFFTLNKNSEFCPFNVRIVASRQSVEYKAQCLGRRGSDLASFHHV